jgi:hypothetical protein
MSVERAARLPKANVTEKKSVISGVLLGSSPISETPGQHNPFTVELADETWLHVFSYLGQPDLYKVAMVNRRFERLALDPSLWQKEICNCFPLKMMKISMLNLLCEFVRSKDFF